MPILVIETATAACSVALIDGADVMAGAHEIVGRGHAERLVPMIGEVLAAAGIARADGVLVDCGPGSFTGIRVGLAAARALGLAWGVPVRGYSAPALIATQGVDRTLTVAIEGGHGELFVQRFARDPLRPLDAVRSLRPEAAAAIADPLVLGSGAAALVAARGSGHSQPLMPNAAHAALLPEPLAVLPATPLYGRAPDAVPQR